MNYAELLEEDEASLRKLHKRCSKLVNKILLSRKYDFKRSDACTKQQLAWDLYTICRGKTYRCFNTDHTQALSWFNFKLPFSCLEELDLKLTIRGY